MIYFIHICYFPYLYFILLIYFFILLFFLIHFISLIFLKKFFIFYSSGGVSYNGGFTYNPIAGGSVTFTFVGTQVIICKQEFENENFLTFSSSPPSPPFFSYLLFFLIYFFFLFLGQALWYQRALW